MLQQKRSVQFLSIEILEFAYTVGDNPSVVNGVPLSSEWTPQRKTILPLCVFEKHRPPHSRECGPRRICSRRREKILLRNGCSIKDMTAAARDVLRIQNERAFTQYQIQTRKLMHSRRKKLSSELVSSTSTINCPSSPVTVVSPSSTRVANKDKLVSPRLSPPVLQRHCWERAFTQYQLQTRKLIHSRRKRDIHQEPTSISITIRKKTPLLSADNSPASSPSMILGSRQKPLSPTDRSPRTDRSPTDISPKLPQQSRSFRLHSSTTSNYPSSPPTTPDKEIQSPRLGTTMLQRHCLTEMLLARNAVSACCPSREDRRRNCILLRTTSNCPSSPPKTLSRNARSA
jgi:hypothetical protein